MTCAALTVIRPVLELSFVLVLVAIHALFMGHRCLEVRILMTLQAKYTRMLAVEGELSGAMVERAG